MSHVPIFRPISYSLRLIALQYVLWIKVLLLFCGGNFALNSQFSVADYILMHDEARMHGNQLLKPT